VPGKLEIIVGPMRSNKTAELLRRIETRREYARQHVLLLKPSADTKAAAGLVESRNRCGKQPYGTGGLLQLRRQGAVSPAPGRGQAGFLCSPIIMAGDFYEPRCAEHFVLPGRPH
jgi:thymidine kinase